jgi:hypothetical protein
MTLSVVVGSSGSGKTTFLNDVHKRHKCTYIRQYHLIRPYIAVSKIPNFDPTALPYWEIYQREGVADGIKVGGTMAGEFTAGLSGGQRKLLLFELIRQRLKNQSELLIVLDEPFAGVTDDFVPFIVERLNEMRKTHNILLVTNDHVETLTKMSDNTITVSAIDRTKVKVNRREEVDRELTIVALAVGDDYVYEVSNADLKFFLDTEVFSNQALVGIAVFTVFAYCLFLATFWNSDAESNAASVVIAGSIVAYFCINPYLLSLVDWRNAMSEESEALLHSSKGMNKILKSFLTLALIFVISLIEWGCIRACARGLDDVELWVGLLFDSASMTFPFICLGIFTKIPFQAVQILGSLPFLLMIFLSTTFSPGAGVPVIKELRYLFARFYLWCTLPGVMDEMEGCPDDLNLLYLILSSFVGVFVFLVAKGVQAAQKGAEKNKDAGKKKQIMEMEEAQLLQVELYGEKALRRLQHQNSSGSLKKTVTKQDSSNESQEDLAKATEDVEA